ncbi:dihydroxy-acid dehydratase domain-containing protein [Aurantiacibacter poecillastricola]|uniref:dihydroxy-acid dehydratase domain-containing protein n=1 Tax=Aurantiacibacter poecillastricola TaxID=3064385 RepID=UPI00273E32B7|nr:dihydroxy-acid dehydratase [Aurantiacibacter sp. 219JJ12-13]MDP5261170.1 dihydroxy-acid dehydratase [Aurantiacibacter sp. 219JJ12-13]
MAKLRSLAANNPGRRANWKALGLSQEDMEKPKIAVVNSSSELAICYAHLDGIAKMVKEEIRAAGGVPFEVRTAAPSDFITGANRSGSYILAGRDIIANDIEVQVEAALLDGMICLTSCDKTPPGHLMAAARLNIPTILVIGGYQQAGEIDGEPVDVEDVWSGQVGAIFGKEPKFPIPDMAENAIMGPGVCAGMATANTMHSVVEALGMCLPGHAPVRANSPKMQENARAAGRRIVEMVHEQLLPRQILTPEAFRNAVATLLAVGGSINAIKHMQATSIEAENGVDIFALMEEFSDVPLLSPVRPTGAVRIEQFEDAGGAQAVLKRLEGRISPDALTCTGKTLAENLAGYEIPGPDVIQPLDAAFSDGPTIAILSGTLADTAVVRLGIRDGSRPEEFTGTARVFEDTQSCMAAIEAGEIKEGDVVIARNQGLRGGPAMGGGASLILFALDAAGLAKTTAFVTDGQLSGLCLKGLTVAEVSPEAAEDGAPIGLVRDGDTVRVSVKNRSLDLDVPAEELAGRSGPGLRVEATGYLANFRDAVRPMRTGGVLVPEKK